MTPLLAVKDITKTYGDLVALQNVTFQIEPNEIVGLIGPNGAGKTTLIGVISGAIAPTSGAIFYRGRSILGLRPYQVGALGIARTFQLVQPFWHLTVLECVMLGALFGSTRDRITDVARARERACALIELVGLMAKTNTPTEELNTPERKRLEIARVIAARPQLLLLDEVMAGVSAGEIREIIALLQGLRDDGISIVVIEHVMQAVRGLSDRVIVLHHGQKIADGPAADVFGQSDVMESYMGPSAGRDGGA
jgi:branched-chain amino acid transport system ATP-binding protein